MNENCINITSPIECKVAKSQKKSAIKDSDYTVA